MNHIEGDYEEIVKWIDENKPFKGVCWAWRHGESEYIEETGEVDKLNFGLFSLVDAETKSGTWVCSRKTKKVGFFSETLEKYVYILVDDEDAPPFTEYFGNDFNLIVEPVRLV